MALLWCDGFDSSSSRRYISKYHVWANGFFPSYIAGRISGLAAVISWPNSIFRRKLLLRHKLNLGSNTIICGAAFQISGNTGEGDVFAFYLGEEFQGALKCAIQADSNFVRFRVVDANGATLETETADFPNANFTFFPAAAWYYIEFKYTFDTVNGAFEVRIDGAPVITSSIAYNTDPKAIGSCDRVGCGPDTVNAVSLGIDDFYILDDTGAPLNDFLAVDAGGVEVNRLSVDGDGAVAQWQQAENGSFGHFQSAQSIDQDEWLFVEDAAGGERSLFTFTNLTSIDQAILGVQVNTIGMKYQGESSQQYRVVYRQPSDGQVGLGNSVAPAAYAETLRYVIMETNPVDSTVFDLTEINDGQWGVEAV